MRLFSILIESFLQEAGRATSISNKFLEKFNQKLNRINWPNPEESIAVLRKDKNDSLDGIFELAAKHLLEEIFSYIKHPLPKNIEYKAFPKDNIVKVYSKSTPDADTLYAQIGFTITGRSKKIYIDPNNTIIKYSVVNPDFPFIWVPESHPKKHLQYRVGVMSPETKNKKPGVAGTKSVPLQNLPTGGVYKKSTGVKKKEKIKIEFEWDEAFGDTYDNPQSRQKNDKNYMIKRATGMLEDMKQYLLDQDIETDEESQNIVTVIDFDDEKKTFKTVKAISSYKGVVDIEMNIKMRSDNYVVSRPLTTISVKGNLVKGVEGR